MIPRVFSPLLCAVLFSSPGWPNVLVNGSFEAPAGFNQGVQGAMPPGWSITHSTPDLYSNDGSFGLAPSSFGNFTGVTAQDGLGWVAGWSGVIESFGQQLSVPLSPNAEYTFSGYLLQAKRADLDNAGAYDILLSNTNSYSGGVVVATLGPTTGADDWEFISSTFTAPSNATDLSWIIFRPYASGSLHSYPGLDNVALNSETVATLPGDFDRDGDVDGRDFLIWQRNRSAGDLADWRANYGTGAVSAANVGIPEPPTQLSAAGVLIVALGWRRRQRE